MLPTPFFPLVIILPSPVCLLLFLIFILFPPTPTPISRLFSSVFVMLIPIILPFFPSWLYPWVFISFIVCPILSSMLPLSILVIILTISILLLAHFPLIFILSLKSLSILAFILFPCLRFLHPTLHLIFIWSWGPIRRYATFHLLFFNDYHAIIENWANHVLWLPNLSFIWIFCVNFIALESRKTFLLCVIIFPSEL